MDELIRSIAQREPVRPAPSGDGSRPRMLHVITRLANGGAGENTLFTVNGLDKRKYDVDLAIGGGSEPGLLRKYGLAEAVKLFVIEHLARDPSISEELPAYREIRRLIRAGGYSVVHTHGAKAGILARLAAHAEGVPVVINGIHGITFSREMPFLKRRLFLALERFTARRTTHFVSVGEDIKQKYLRAGVGSAAQYRVVHSGMDLERFHRAGDAPPEHRRALRRELGLAESDLVVGKVSRLEPRKGYDFFLEAARGLISDYPADAAGRRVRFLVVGDGPEYDRIRARVAELGLDDRFVFTGYRSDVPELLSVCDVVCLTSLWEGLPRVLVEASAVGLPAVTFDVDGAWEVVEEGRNGFIVPTRDSAAVAERLYRLVSSEELRVRMSAAARTKVDESWSAATMVRRLEELYEEALS